MQIFNKQFWHNIFHGENSRERNARENFKALYAGASIEERAAILQGAFTAPSPDYVLGMDDSHWGGELDFTHTYERGMRFAIFKCIDGTVHTKWWDVNRPKAMDAGLIVGDYAWLYRNANVSCVAQARAYWDRIKNLPIQLPPTIDFEWTKYAGTWQNPNYSDLTLWVDEFVRISGIKPMLYSAAGYMNQFGAMPASLRSKFSAFWFANYGVESPALPLGFTSWDFWQFTASLEQGYFAPSSLGKKELDGNYWKGSLEQLKQFAGVIDGGTPSPPPPPTNGGTMTNGKAKEILGKTSTIRTTPAVEAGNDTGRRVSPYMTIEFAEVVPGKLVAADRWLRLPDNTYVNYIVSGRAYYQIIQQPVPDQPPPPPPPSSDVPASIELQGSWVDGQGNVLATYKGTLNKQ